MKLIVDMPIGADLVDRAVLYERLKQWQDAAYDALTLSFLHEVKMLIGSAPHVKAVELVRCGECKHWDEKPLIKNEKGMTRFGVCRLWHDGYLKADFYCADAERKEKEND